MGWTHCYNACNLKNGKVDRRAECDRLLNWEKKDENGKFLYGCRVLKSAMVGSVYYAAVERRNAEGKRDVGAAVFLTCGRTKHDSTIWGYKDMDETMGPYYYDCPASILDLLTPTDHATANEWRKACRDRIAQKAEERRNGKKPLFIPEGVTVDARRGSWVISSTTFKYRTGYTGMRFTKRSWHNFDDAMRRFLKDYGTDAQKREFAMSGRECPAEWKSIAA